MSTQSIAPRVPRKELSYNEQDARYYHNGVLFTGRADSEHNGYREDQEFRKGFRWGSAHTYSPDGRLIGESNFRMDLQHGLQREWDDNGRLTFEAWCEHGIVMKEREWDEGGNLVKDVQRREDDPNLLEMRRLYGTPEQVQAEEAAFRGGGVTQ
jgi:hypothetical protein